MTNSPARSSSGSTDTQEKMVGVVETVGVEEEKGFNGIDEIWAILNMAGKKRTEMK